MNGKLLVHSPAIDERGIGLIVIPGVAIAPPLAELSPSAPSVPKPAPPAPPPAVPTCVPSLPVLVLHAVLEPPGPAVVPTASAVTEPPSEAFPKTARITPRLPTIWLTR